MPLLRRRPLLRAAAVSGGAYVMGKRRERGQEEERQRAYDEGQRAGAPSGQATGGMTTEDTARLSELGKLHEQGVLTDDEFTQQKARILGTG